MAERVKAELGAVQQTLFIPLAARARATRRSMVAASVLDQDWMPAVRDSPGPYFFTADGVLAYLDQAPHVITRIAAAFPGG